MFDAHVLLTGFIVFLDRICDVCIGTVRTIVTAHGRTALAFKLAIFEFSIWATVVSMMLKPIYSPLGGWRSTDKRK